MALTATRTIGDTNYVDSARGTFSVILQVSVSSDVARDMNRFKKSTICSMKHISLQDAKHEMEKFLEHNPDLPKRLMSFHWSASIDL